MAAQQIGKLKLFLVLLPIPILWALFSQLEVFNPYYKPLSNLAMDWRYRIRGPLDVPEVKVAYADVDGPAINFMGERPWSRLRFGQLAQILFDVGKARAVGYDFIFSEFTSSEMVPLENVRGSDYQFGKIIRQYPNIVLAANYTGVELPLTFEQRELDQTKELVQPYKSFMPFRNRDLGPKGPTPETSLPEMPTFPVIDIDVGTVGLIAFDDKLSGDAVPRYVPLFAEAKGPYFTLNLLKGYDAFYETVDKDSFMPMGDLVFIVDKDGDSRSLPLNTERTFYHMSIELALKYLGLTHDNVEVLEDAIIIRDNEGEEVIHIPMVDGQFAEVNWFSSWLDSERNPRASLATIIQQFINWRDGEGEIKDQADRFFKQFNDAIVLVGPVDPTLQDLAPTPFDSAPVPKVGMHGNMIKTLFSGLYIKRMSPGMNAALVILLTIVVAVLGLYSGHFSVLAKIGSVLALAGYIVIVFLAFNTLHLVVPLIAPVASAITTTTAGALFQLFVEERQKSRIKGMFGTYLSPQLVNEMVESGEEPSLGGEDAEITAFFSDVQSFSSFSELLQPAQLVHLMNEYLTAMTDILMEEGSYVDKYIGDAIVAMFNAPVHLQNHALRGCIAAARIQKRQLELREKWASEGDTWPGIVSKMQTRIGLNTGNATVGNMGSENRFNYTMMGDTVNLAARCESGAKTAGVYTLVTVETMKAAIAAGDDVLFRFVDKWQVKGRSEAVDMYEVVGLQADMPDSARECVRLYEQAFALYLKQDWDAAIALFAQSAALEPNQPDKTPGVTTNPSLVLTERCEVYKANPPGDDWDGVFVMKTK